MPSRNNSYLRPNQHAAMAAHNLAHELSRMAWSASVPNEDYVRGWEERAARYINSRSFKTDDLAATLWACAVLDSVQENKPLREIAEKIYQTLLTRNHAQLERGTFHKIGQACLWFDWFSPCHIPSESTTISDSEKTMRQIFTQAGHKPDTSSAEITTLEHKVDLSFTQSPHPILIECDGHPHFVFDENPDNPVGYNGPTIFQTALITKLAANAVLLRVPFTVQNVIFKAAAERQTEIIDRVMKELLEKKPGAYDLRLDKEKNPFVSSLELNF
jgi:hypothetical protein